MQASRDEIRGLQDWCDIGFTRVNMRPVKEVLQTYASKWMFTYTKYLSDQVMRSFDNFIFMSYTWMRLKMITNCPRVPSSWYQNLNSSLSKRIVSLMIYVYYFLRLARRKIKVI